MILTQVRMVEVGRMSGLTCTLRENSQIAGVTSDLQ